MFAGALFPFVFITIACGALSGFHSLIASGTTPKMIEKETQVRFIGYGAMLMESFVAVMAMIAASIIEPGLYYAMNAPAGVLGDTRPVGVAGGQRARLPDLARRAAGGGRRGRGGDARRAHRRRADAGHRHVGDLRRRDGRRACKAFWYHFAIMFEALFILTTVDAGTRVGRFMLQDTLGNVIKPFANVSWKPGLWLTSAIVVGAWGWFLYGGVTNPLGGINQLFPLFGIANQLLAAVALTVATTLLIKAGKLKWAWVTGIPLAWDAAVTLTASYQKVFSDDPKLGFFAQRDRFQDGARRGRGARAREEPRRHAGGRHELDRRRRARRAVRGPDHHRDRRRGADLGARDPRARAAADDRDAVRGVDASSRRPACSRPPRSASSSRAERSSEPTGGAR